jgi:GTP-binding protein
MQPTLVLVGRPNVGKSTLFNRLTGTRDALVADLPGLTRDRHYGRGRFGERRFLVVDTGGFEPVSGEGISREMARQTERAIDEADAILFLVDGRAGLTGLDQEIASRLRATGRPVWLVVNKAEGMRPGMAAVEFHALGLGEPWPVSSAHGEGVGDLLEAILDRFPEDPEPEPVPEAQKVPRVAVVGRPNVGKSTLVNALLGEQRMLVYDFPGTTRDSIDVEFERGGRRYVLVDTAGMRRRARIDEAVEKFSVIKTLQAIDGCNVAVLVLDAREPVSDQDAHIAGYILEAGRALVLVANKWDALDAGARTRFRDDLERRLGFLAFARTLFISAQRGSGVDAVLPAVDKAWRAAMIDLPTPRLTRALMAAVERQSPPRSGLVRPKLRYAHQGGSNPPVIVIHGNALDSLPASYRRYLEHAFRAVFRLEGTPLRLQFRTGGNPFASRRAPATGRRSR